ncbi:MAG TPA: S1 RNA-binding domain-containing protein [Bacilli bacterium]|nr:S1 RNA-binding domain-containing protein [Bacilli bacterium]HPS18880.1 S1 RNA-binding domain-containing protein [Bacilli bacterium]
MSYEVGQLIVGHVVNVKPYALFMSFEDGSQGLLHISEISNSYIRDIEKFGSVGDEMCVKIISIDPSNGFLRVSLKQVPSDQVYNTHSNAARKIPVVKEGDFAPLEKKLPQWKETTLEKIKGEKDETEIK